MPTMTYDIKAFNSVRPRERLLQSGAHSLNDAELVAIILRTGSKQLSVLQLAQRLLNQFDGLAGLLNTDINLLLHQPGIGHAKACELIAIQEINRRALAEHLQAGPVMNQPTLVKQYCIALLGHLKIEHCFALFLNNQLQLITSEEIAKGTINQASVYPREVVRSALKHHATAVILAHNHPSGTQRASHADVTLTKHLKQALALVDIQLLDHFIVTRGHANSMAEEGLI